MVETEIDAPHLVETMKVMYLVDELNEKLRFLNCITTKIGSKMSDMHGEEINRLISEQKKYETQYGKLLTLRSEQKGLSNKRKLKETLTELNEVSIKLKESTKNLCKALKENPDVVGNLFKIKDDKEKIVEQLDLLMEELQSGDINNFVNFSKAQKENLKILDNLKKDEKDFIIKINESKMLYKKSKDEFKKEDELNDAELKKCKKEQNETKINADVSIRYEEKLIHGQESCQTRLFDHEISILKNTKQQLIERKKTEALVSERIKKYHKNKMDEANKQVNDWEKQKEIEIEKIDAKIEQIKKETEEDAKLMEERKKL